MEIFAAVVGISFRPASAKEAMKSLEIGNALSLEADPENPYDSNAVKVIDPASGEFIGFLSRESNAETAAHLADGGEVECEIVSFLSSMKPHVRITLLG